MIPKGIQTVTCKHCGVTGTIRIGRRLSNGSYKILDFIEHEEACPQYQREQPKHLQRKNWRQQERRANTLVGARETPASGALGMDGDGRKFHEWRVEAKQTTKKVYVLPQSVWTKLVDGALLSGEEPVLHVQVLIDSPHKKTFVAIRRDLYDALADVEPKTYPEQRNKKSYSIPAWGRSPFLIELEPIGVVLTEEEFGRLKEKIWV